MSNLLVLRHVSRRLPKRFRHSRQGCPSLLTASGLAACVAGLLVLGPVGTSAAETSGDKPSPSPHMAQDGFTRESMAELGRPEPTPAPSAVGASTRRTRVHTVHADPKDFSPQRHVAHRAPPPTHARPQIVIQGRHHRNPVVRFVYWWNGWVIRTFHTRIGTVMLHTVGAKT